ncbi:MAG: hypothetical protein QOD77_1971 [Thermoplasmata archaeon]|jgi:hypothetical protein|nr:hypothetical protein [Thermoplasmata archaeon]
MDLDARTRQFLAHLQSGEETATLALVAPDCMVTFNGKAMAAAKAIPKALGLVGGRGIRIEVVELMVKRNVVFTQWRALLAPDMPVARGLLVLSWDQDGRVANANVDAQVESLG